MKSLTILSLLIFSLNPLKVSASFLKVQTSELKLSKFTCEVLDEIPRQDFRTIAITKLRNNFSSRLFDEVSKCVPENVAIVQMDLKSANVNVKFVLLIGDNIDWVIEEIFLRKLINF